MEHIGLITQSFENSIHSLSLRFKDPTLEETYKEAQVSLKFIDSTTKRFLLLILAGHFSVNLIDVLSAAIFTPGYSFSTGIWVVYSFLLVIAFLEALFFYRTSLSWARGLAITIIGCFVLFHNDFATFQAETFYPFTAEEYF